MLSFVKSINHEHVESVNQFVKEKVISYFLLQINKYNRAKFPLSEKTNTYLLYIHEYSSFYLYL